ncbi:5-formyltetrahydrofolate cyclo-ligase [Candidatus Desulforudis audaxviator]|uniref:5-formyltetrahydrofolate cyclo-ligase n=1 Tax=Candidatus Desulforudis audaxviator TaxID=471827 RepID=UPI001FAD5C45|nr:5-formyltetrahydrofolate cyclo-ligase [Candidatus Desulforudis audaxviator]
MNDVCGKQELRAAMLKARSLLDPAAAAEAGAVIARRVRELPAFRQARCLLAYVDVRNEVGTGTLIRAALDAGKTVAVPVTDRARRRLIPARITTYPEGLEPGAFGVPEPRYFEEIVDAVLDCILVPGVAFDGQGYRLGFGGGFYDRFLRRVGHRAVRIGLAYDFQICPTVYPDPHDEAVDYVVTEGRVLDLRAGR